MDNLLVEVAGVSTALDSVLGRYSSAASSTLFLIKARVRTLEAAVEDIRQWLHLSDPTHIAQVNRRLQDAIAVVKGALTRLWYDLDSIRQSLPDQPPSSSEKTGSARNAGFAFDEGRMRTHLCDVRECARLMHFALGVCQSPADRIEEREAQELTLGTIMLFRAHATTDRERRMVILDHMPESRQKHSAYFNDFMEAVLKAEEDLLQDYSHRTRAASSASHQSHSSKASKMASWSLPGRPSTSSRSIISEKNDRDGDRSEESTAASSSNPPSTPSNQRQSTLTRNSSSSSLLTTESLNTSVPPTDDGASIASTLQRSQASLDFSRPSASYSHAQVLRKPVGRPSQPYGGPGSITVARPMSMNGIRQRDALLALASSSGGGRLGQGERTSHLFREASGSLNTLTAEFSASRLGEEIESPPPYVNPSRAASVAGSVKGGRPGPPGVSHSSSSGGGAGGGYAEIFRAIRENKMDVLRTLLHNGGIVDEVDRLTQRTALMEAAVLRRNEAILMLLNVGARVHLKDSSGWTALHFAALQGDARSCTLLLDSGAQLDEYSSNGETPLQLAARGGHTEAIICLLNSWAVQRGNRQTLLRAFYEASRCGNVSSAQAFVDKGVKPKNINESWSPISCAAESGSIPMLDFMIGQGCSLKDRSPDGWTALHYAARYGHTSMVEKLLALKLPWKAQTKKTEETALHLAAIAGHTSTAFALITHKDANVTFKDADGQQALHHAVRNGDLTLTTALLAQGAKVEDMNSYGWQPIHLAAAYGHLPLVADFLTRGVGVEDKLGMSSVRPQKRTNEAARRGYWAEIRWPHSGARPLHLALEFGHDEVATVLIASGARIEATDSHAWRPLHYAAFNCRPAMVSHLLSRGAAPQPTNDDNCTPLSLGFREQGLAASDEDKANVTEMLQAASDREKKSKFKQLAAGFRASPTVRSKAAEGRNRTWHTAELAAALYQDYDALGESVIDEGDSQYNFSESSQARTITEEGPSVPQQS